MAADDIDRELARLQAAAERVGKNLVDTENDSAWRMLGQASLRGVSASRRAEAERALGEVWHWYGELTSLLERATAVRRSRRTPTAQMEAELRSMLTGASVELDSAHVALADRDLLAPSRKVKRGGPNDVLAMMAAGFETVRAVIGGAAQAWDSYVPRLTHARELLTAAADAVHVFGGGDASSVDELQRRVGALAERLVTDPLSVVEQEVSAAEEDVVRLQAEVDAVGDLRDNLGRRLDEARARLTELDRATAAAHAARREATVKIAGATAVAAPPDRRAELRAELAGVARRADAGQWRPAQELLAEGTDRAAQLLGQLRAGERRDRGLIESRDELRSRLEAYRVKAERIGTIEAPGVAEAYERARVVLYTAPTDLDEAAALVAAFQHVVAAPTQGSVSR